MILSKKLINQFKENGFVEIKSNKVKRDVVSLRNEIREIAIYFLEKSLKIKVNKNLSLERLLYKIAQKEKKNLSAIYDLCKTLESFHKLSVNDDILRIARFILNTKKIFFHKEFSGVRLDSNLTENQTTLIHQEIHSFPFAINGLVVWIPISKVDKNNGSIILWPKTHNKINKFLGNKKTYYNNFKKGNFQIAQKAGKINIIEKNLKNRKIINSNSGSIYLIDIRLIHKSKNSSKKNNLMRITFQNRIFDFKDSFFQWKLKNYSMNDGLRNPFLSQKLLNEFNENL